MALIQITAYVRNEHDLALWKALPNKTEWLCNNLASIRTRTKLSPEGVAAYEKMSGFKTDGDVTFTQSSDNEYELLEQLMEPKLTPPEEVA